MILKVPALLIILFVVYGIIFSGMFPLWEGQDEHGHFGYVQYISEKKNLPSDRDNLSNEIVYTFEKTPTEALSSIAPEFMQIVGLQPHPYSTYWDNFDLKEIQNNRKLISSQPLESRINSESVLTIYEAIQPPLSYLVQAPVYLLFYDQDILTRVFTLRIFSILVTAAAAVVAYKTISLLFDDRFMRVGSLMFIVFNPMFTSNVSRVNNEALTILLFSVFLYLMVLYLKGKTNTKFVIIIGVVLSLGLLTKVTFMPAVMLVPIFIFLKYIQKNTQKPRISILQSFKNLGLIFGITIPMVSWWYYERFGAGNITGVPGLHGINIEEFIQAIFEFPWVVYHTVFFNSFWGTFGFSYIVAPSPYFQIVIIFICISIAGLGYGIAVKLKQHGGKIFRNWRYQSIFVFGLSFPLIILAQLMFNIQYWAISEQAVPAGWYTFISFTAIAMILLLGYRTIIINSKLKQFKEESLLAAFII